MSVKFFGSVTALVTTFDENLNLDMKSFENNVDFQIKNGTHGFVPAGTTGESPTLTTQEHKDIIKKTVELAKSTNAFVIAGTGSNNTKEAVEYTKHAQDCGADGALIVTPYYNKPNQSGLFAHYSMILENTDIPIIIYNIPGRSVIDIEDETILRLVDKFGVEKVAGVKDATGNPLRTSQLLSKIGDENFVSLSGDDGLVKEFMENGSSGCISVMSNLIPAECSQMFNAWFDGDKDKFYEIANNYNELANNLFIEPNPCPVKFAMKQKGLIDFPSLRLPLVDVCDETQKIIIDTMKKTNLV